MIYADIYRPSIKQYARLYDFALILGGSLFIALAAQIAIPLPFSPVPVTGQTLAVLLTGILLGSRRGSVCLFLYLAEGSIGLPVFAGGAAGLIHLLGPTGGYLLGFVVAAFLTGWLAERGWDRRIATSIIVMLLGNCVIFCFGLLWLAYFVGPARVIGLGLVPFIAGEIVKMIIAAMILPSGWKLLEGTRGKGD